MALCFITGNKNKFLEVKEIIGDVEQLEMDLPELQSLDSREIITAKLKEALKHHKGPCIVEDTSLSLFALNGFPGPFIKWFMESLGLEGISSLVSRLQNPLAKATTVIGYAASPAEIHFFEGSIDGEIVQPQGDKKFGWDPIFKPKGCQMTFAQMTQSEKNDISMRREALKKLKGFLEA
ncbi:non-canonical purine NTP pyrophosphatase [Candidatus Pacearchaeota archaeon]|nr:non-canonical purine NTP pyrophosphatase [Candidatus Pacearchaeota archaeon]